MNNPPDNPLSTAVRRMLRPLVRLLLRNGVAYADFIHYVKKMFIEVADEDFSLPGRNQSVSRIAVVTGINRKEVKRVLDEGCQDSDRPESNRAARVVKGWIRDEAYRDQNGKPRALCWGAGDNENSFEDLVKKYSGDIPARSILDEMIRLGAAILTQDNQVQLASSGYVPASNKEELLRLSGESVGDLLSTIDHNLAGTDTTTRLQMSVAYDDVSTEGVELFQKLSRDKSLELLHYLDGFLSTHDRTINPAAAGTGRHRTGIGIYFFEEALDEHTGE
ncbi:hypothetical protein AB833_25560 [Chromatiales bacterium (ex Bugula neritina AB1)]|nr:hypothetical protein AB833_25560 [Chromatiales bacterium (ex Bugula neritina AB1)]